MNKAEKEFFKMIVAEIEMQREEYAPRSVADILDESPEAAYKAGAYDGIGEVIATIEANFFKELGLPEPE